MTAHPELNAFTQDPTLLHRHQCGLTSFGKIGIGCDHQWSHTTLDAKPGTPEYARAHMCPQCGRGPWYHLVA